MRIVAMRLNPKYLLDVLWSKLPLFDCNFPLPEDARIVSIEREYDGDYYDRYVVLIESKEFDEVLEDEAIPYIHPVCKEKDAKFPSLKNLRELKELLIELDEPSRKQHPVFSRIGYFIMILNEEIEARVKWFGDEE